MDEVYIGVREDCHTLNVGLNENCTDIEVYQYSTYEDDGKVLALQCDTLALTIVYLNRYSKKLQESFHWGKPGADNLLS